MRVVFVCLLLLFTSLAEAALAPEEIMILTAAGSRTSQEIAEYYAKARNIPRSHICRLDVTATTDLSRAEWDEKTRPEILIWLREQTGGDKIRCCVVAWDLPLRVEGYAKDSPVFVARQENLAREKRANLSRLHQLLRALDAIGPEQSPPDRDAPDLKAGTASLAAELDRAIQAAQARVRKLEGKARRTAEAELDRSFVTAAGIGGLLELMAKQQGSKPIPADIAKHVQEWQAQNQALQREIGLASIQTESVERDERLLKTLAPARGLLAVLEWIDGQEKSMKRNESRASFDSELSLIRWPAYPLERWLVNPLHYAFDRPQDPAPRREDAAKGSGHIGPRKGPEIRPKGPSVLMVSRLAAPTPDAVKQLIDASIAVEKTGLAGTFYIDARGLAFDPKRDVPGSYPRFDQSLRDLADLMARHSAMRMVFDNKGPLFQPGQCPEAALYCGWYSHRKYVDAFTWQPGAVGYHVASSEAVELIRPDSTLWCPAMLQRSVAATLGPTFEPYLAAFPAPDDFFPLLMTGRYNLVETYYRTVPFLSWAMALVGDPLYNPFKNRPMFDEKDLPERLRPKP